MRVLIVPDKFKGTLTATAAAAAIAKGWLRIRPQDKIELLPMSDGGDGFGEVLSKQIKATRQRIGTVDAAHRRCVATWWWGKDTKTAIIESANVIGLARLPADKFHPFELDTFGLGAVVSAAAQRGARNCLVGIGGSATNDAGFGLARSLGWEFLDQRGQPITRWTDLHKLASLHRPQRLPQFASLVLAVDVQNVLLGPRGCTRVYGPQKGIRPIDFPDAERALRKLALVVESELGIDHASEPGAGAAGGLGFGFSCFLGAKLESGFDLFARHANLAKLISRSDIVLTGEGAIDRQTLMGKGVGQVGLMCRKQKVPCVALAGTILTGQPNRCFTHTLSLTELTTLEHAKVRAAFWLEKLASRVALDLN
ncbi:MAG TPA: glycerate kinase [Verrucomicrobiae bacterium]|nr:glycerate kinase [Verrucomicrobiae bacterium]